VEIVDSIGHINSHDLERLQHRCPRPRRARSSASRWLKLAGVVIFHCSRTFTIEPRGFVLSDGNRRQLSYDVLPYLDLFSTKQQGQIYQYILVFHFYLKEHVNEFRCSNNAREYVMTPLMTQDCIDLSKKACIKPIDPPGWMFGQVVGIFCCVHSLSLLLTQCASRVEGARFLSFDARIFFS
jgi:hypothetical protein